MPSSVKIRVDWVPPRNEGYLLDKGKFLVSEIRVSINQVFNTLLIRILQTLCKLTDSHIDLIVFAVKVALYLAKLGGFYQSQFVHETNFLKNYFVSQLSEHPVLLRLGLTATTFFRTWCAECGTSLFRVCSVW